MNIEQAIDIIDKELHKKWDKKVERKDEMTYIHLGDDEPLNEFEKASQRCLVEVQSLNREIERQNKDIKVLLKENGNKEKVIKAQDSIIKEVRELLQKANIYRNYDDDEVEIIKEDKKIEKLDYVFDVQSPTYNESWLMTCIKANKDKINEIIDYLNKGDK